VKSRPSPRAVVPTLFDPEEINHRAFEYYARLQRIQRYVREHPEESISLRRAARISRLSEAYFSAFFHQKVGVRFRDWRAHEKVLHAIRLLQTHNYTITEVAMGLGFSDLRTFERTFKRHTGLTPRQFKRAVRP
jgi:AraC-like DNA-binding protein